MNTSRYKQNFLRCAVFMAIVCSACIAHHFSDLIVGNDAYYPADRIVRFIADRFCAIGFVPVLVISVILGMLAAALAGRPRERDAYLVLRTAAVAEVFCFIAFTLLCWVSEAFGPRTIDPRFIRPLIVAAVVTALLSLALWRSQRKISVAGLLSTLLFTAWVLLPRPEPA